ncbi:hypothetical protein ACOZ4N_15480 [Halorientalis pallida]|uniref:hypothetical protein n=1 Tax=Halorientalis pallida TaxID=2479928 RepID=UPI003C6F9BC0
MPSRRAIDAAKAGPTIAALLVVTLVVLWVGLSLAAGPFLTRDQRAAFGGVIVGLFSLSVLYQAVFMLRYPDTAVEEEITPPTTPIQRRLGMRDLLTPSSRLGARVIGLFGLLGAAFGFAWAALFLGAGLGLLG